MSGNQLVAVTGGSAGVGLELARIFAQRGNPVVICGRDERRLEAAASSLPAGVTAVRADLGRENDVMELADRLAALGGVSVLVNNAGIQLNYAVADRPTADLLADIDHEFDVNLIGPVRLAARCLPQLLARPGGALVNVTSGLAFVPKASAPIYCAAKAGLHAFSKSLRHQVGDRVHVLEAVLPLVETAMTAGRGSGKLSATQAATAIVRALDGRVNEAHIGRVRLLLAIQRLSPRLADRILANS